MKTRLKIRSAVVFAAVGILYSNTSTAQICTVNPPEFTDELVSGQFIVSPNSEGVDDFATVNNAGISTVIEIGNAHSGGYQIIPGWSGIYSSSNIQNRVVSGDFDNDNKIDDIAAFYDAGSGQTRLDLWKGLGSAQPGNNNYFHLYQNRWFGANYTASRITGRVVSGDFDNDGKHDDIAAFYDYGGSLTKIHTFRSSGGSSPTFTAHTNWTGTSYTASRITDRVVSGDFDGDNFHDDIAVLYDYGNSQTRIHVFIMENGMFRVWTGWTGTSFTASATTNRVVSGDFDSDGVHDDIATMYYYGNGFSRAWVFETSGGSYPTFSANDYWTTTSGYTATQLNGKMVSASKFNDDTRSQMLGVYDYGSSTNKFHRFDGKNPLWGNEYFQFNTEYFCNTRSAETPDEEELITKIDMEPELSVFPNPAQNNINLGLFNLDDGSATLEIMDVYGKLVYSKTEVLTAGEQKIKLDIDELPSGIYFLSVGARSGKKQTIRFVKQ